ncbi:MAG: hypothetical protein AAF441_08505 [Pseudomonadota bacterium]
MGRTISSSILSGIIALSALAAVQGTPANASQCSLRNDLAGALKSNPGLTWSDIREACNKDIAAYRASDMMGATWLENAANGFSGLPYVLLKVFPDLAPEIWGKPEDFYSLFGLFKDPYAPNRALPRGLGIASTAGRPVNAEGVPTGEIDYAKPGLYVVTLSCGACHTGRAKANGKYVYMDGAPNTQFDVRKWRQAFIRTLENYLSPAQIGTAAKPGPTAQKLVEIIDSKPKGFFADGLPELPTDPELLQEIDAGQRAFIKQNIVKVLGEFAIGAGSTANSVALQKNHGSSYGWWNSPGLAGYSAGMSDGSGDLLVALISSYATETAMKEGKQVDTKAFLAERHPALPSFATVTDIPSIWNQKLRSTGQWDGSVTDPFWRNIAAQLPIVMNPTKVDLTNTYITANFVEDLPSPPYPFDVDLQSAARGEALFNQNCATCHQPHNETQYWDTHTDFNRAEVLNPAGLQLFAQGFQASCHDVNFTYKDKQGNVHKPCAESVTKYIRNVTDSRKQGYVADVLDGVWARAPYLHNGSVPTLEHLLAPRQRPTRFVRGALDYDTQAVGFEWRVTRKPELEAEAPTLFVYNTMLDGLTNVGHNKDIWIDGKLYRLDWGHPSLKQQRADLIEYLKTR